MYQFLYKVLEKIPSLPSLPNMDLVIDFVKNLIVATAYFLPLPSLMAMFGLWILIINWHFIYRILTKIWESIPFN